MSKQDIQQIFFKWLDSEKKDPVTQTLFAKKYKVTPVSLSRWKDVRSGKYKRPPKPIIPRDENGNYDSMAYLKSKRREVDVYLLNACRKMNPNAIKLFKQLTGDLKDLDQDADKIDAGKMAASMIKAMAELNQQGLITARSEVGCSTPLVEKLDRPNGLSADSAQNTLLETTS